MTRKDWLGMLLFALLIFAAYNAPPGGLFRITIPMTLHAHDCQERPDGK